MKTIAFFAALVTCICIPFIIIIALAQNASRISREEEQMQFMKQWKENSKVRDSS